MSARTRTSSVSSTSTASSDSDLEPLHLTFSAFRKLLRMSTPFDEGPIFPSYLLPSLGRLKKKRKPTREPELIVPNERYFPDDSSSASPSSSSTPSSSSPPSDGYTTTSSSPSNASTRSGALFNPISKAPTRTPSHPIPSIIRCSTCSTHLAYTSQILSKGFTGRHGRAYLITPLLTSTTSTAHPSTLAPSPSFTLPSILHRYLSRSRPLPAEDKVDKENTLLNISIGKPQQRQLATGSHTVADISCLVCGAEVGWKYTDARDEGQRYKIGRYILEMGRCVVGREWGDELEGRDLDSDEGKEMGSTSRPSTSGGSGRSSEEGPCGSVMAALRIKRERREKLEREGRIEFDSEDESEQEDLFEGVWDEAVVRLRRAKQKVREENRRRGVMRRGTAP